MVKNVLGNPLRTNGYHDNHPPIGINKLFDELITVIFNQCTFPMLFAFGRSCTRYNSLSKRAEIWGELCLKMQKFIPFNTPGGLSLSSTNGGNCLPDPLYKDIFCNALQNSKQEVLQRALFAECASCYHSADAKNNLLETVHLIKKYEIAPTSAFKTKIDLLFAEFIILKPEFNVKKSKEDEDAAFDIIQNVLSSESTSLEEKAWATCLVGQHFFYNDEDLIINDKVLTDQDVLDLQESVVTNTDLPFFYRQAADLYQKFLYLSIDIEEMPREDVYKLLRQINVDPDLFPTFKAKSTLKIASMDYQDDIGENDQLFLRFQQVSNNELAFPADKNLAIIHQVKMRVRGLTNCISYEQADQLVNQLVSDPFTNPTIKNQAMLYKITMNVSKWIHSMNDQEIVEKLDGFRNVQAILSPEDRILIRLNIGLMLVQGRVKECTHLNAVLLARTLFSLVIQYTAEDDTGSIGEYRALAQKELALLV